MSSDREIIYALDAPWRSVWNAIRKGSVWLVLRGSLSSMGSVSPARLVIVRYAYRILLELARSVCLGTSLVNNRYAKNARWLIATNASPSTSANPANQATT
jgi:hypothetical protein